MVSDALWCLLGCFMSCPLVVGIPVEGSFHALAVTAGQCVPQNNQIALAWFAPRKKYSQFLCLMR